MLVEKRIKERMEERGIGFELLEHIPVYTSEQAKEVRSITSPDTGVKALVFRVDDSTFILALCPGEKKVATKVIAKMECVKSLTLATQEEVEQLTGLTIGCIAPFGMRTALKTYVDQDLLDKRFLFFSGGSYTKTIKMRADDFLKLLEKPIMFSSE